MASQNDHTAPTRLCTARLIVQAAAQSGVGLGQAQSKTARLWIHIGRSSLSGNASFLLSGNVDPLAVPQKNFQQEKKSQRW